MFVSHVMCALDEVRPLTCTFVIAQSRTGSSVIKVISVEVPVTSEPIPARVTPDPSKVTG